MEWHSCDYHSAPVRNSSFGTVTIEDGDEHPCVSIDILEPVFHAIIEYRYQISSMQPLNPLHCRPHLLIRVSVADDERALEGGLFYLLHHLTQHHPIILTHG